jgi:hypothetical protein
MPVQIVVGTTLMARMSKVLARLLNVVPSKEMEGIQLEGPFWEVEGSRLDYAEFFRRLPDLVSDQAVFFLEGGAHPPALSRFLEEHAVPPRVKVARGTLWPRGSVFHVPTEPSVLMDLAELAEQCAGPEICDHLHVYEDDRILLEWHDAFSDPFSVSRQLSEERMQEFCRKLNVEFKAKEEGTA